jgi:predicted dehydrogenase
MDLGCYPVHWLRSLFPGTAAVRSATAERNPSGADIAMRAELTFPGEVTATVAGRTTYDHQLEAVLDGLRAGSPLPTEGDDPIGTMALIDAIYEAAGFDRSAWT